ncbi:MAG: type II toxin-antitoxin system Phd/YefM family antitoxin [Lactobacillaceae bacterium]|jgi:prevent-host-death family protein|nr:type II toxin-antitoxin system Phd/YefM family antitoxin [Lactobacillaceae bacterium]
MTVTATTAQDLKQNFKQYMDNVTEYGDQVIITRPHSENAVIISEKELSALQNTAYLYGNEANRKHLEQSFSELDRGEGKVLNPQEWQDLQNQYGA